MVNQHSIIRLTYVLFTNLLRNNEHEVSRKFGKTELSTTITKPTIYYNLDVILAVGYRVNSKRGTMFRKWANSVLKQYLLNGYAINNNRILAYQSNMQISFYLIC